MSLINTPAEHSKPGHPITIGAGAVIVHEDRVLLVRNIHGVTRGRYLLPAGRVKPGEPPDVAAVRETFEETHLRVEIEGLLGVRLWVMDDGEHNYFFMFRARLLSPLSDLHPNTAEIDDAQFFSREELEALNKDETWKGLVAIAYKALDPQAALWFNYADLSDNPEIELPDKWRIWM